MEQRDKIKRAADLLLLEILHQVDVEGLPFSEISRRSGLSRAGVAGRIKRVRDAELPYTCKRKRNQDGGMPPRWWARCP